ncbi:MAG TPA: hypothetical protein VEK06_04375, partial [Myxococcota bacterium]|nr:hypothetical protein [Myxococcota bacterium]
MKNKAAFKAAFAEIKDAQKLRELRGILLDHAHDKDEVSSFIDNLAEFGFALDDLYEVDDGSGSRIHGSLLYVMTKRAIFVGKLDASHQAYTNLQAYAGKVKGGLVDYCKHICQDTWGDKNEKILDVLDQKLSSFNKKLRFPGLAHYILGADQEVLASHVLAALAASNNSMDIVRWLYEAVVANAGFPSLGKDILGGLAKEKRDGNGFLHLLALRPASMESLALFRRFFYQFSNWVNTTHPGDGPAEIANILKEKNNANNTPEFLMQNFADRPNGDDTAAIGDILNLIKTQQSNLVTVSNVPLSTTTTVTTTTTPVISNKSTTNPNSKIKKKAGQYLANAASTNNNVAIVQNAQNNTRAATQVATGSFARANKSLDELKQKAQQPWSELVKNNPANEIIVSYLRQTIDMNAMQHKIEDLVLVGGNIDTILVDQKGEKLRSLFRGILPASALVNAINNAI